MFFVLRGIERGAVLSLLVQYSEMTAIVVFAKKYAINLFCSLNPETGA